MNENAENEEIEESKTNKYDAIISWSQTVFWIFFWLIVIGGCVAEEVVTKVKA